MPLLMPINYDNNMENGEIMSILQTLLKNQNILLQKLNNMENDMEKLKADQSQSHNILQQLVKRNVYVGNNPDFPIASFEDMERVNKLILDDQETFVAKIRTILRPGGLEKNFDRLLHMDVYLACNYDGVNGKRGLKEFKALHEAIFEAVKEEGVTYENFKKNMQHCFKSYKNRFYAKKCRDSKKPNK